MANSIKFYNLINFENACPRRTIFRLNGIKGISQYYPVRKDNERKKIFEHLVKKFSLNKKMLPSVKIDNEFKTRIKKEDIIILINNLDSLISENKIKITEINKANTYSIDGFSVELIVDALGDFQGKKALFSLNLTSKFKRTDAFSLVLSEFLLRNTPDKVEELVVLKLGSGEERIILEKGDRTKSGMLAKKRLPPWDELRNEAIDILKRGHELRKKMEQKPNSFNTPVFGTCGTCPYHNVEVSYNGNKFTCIG